MNELTERRQRLLDQIRTHGPEHFDMGAVLQDRLDWTQEDYGRIDFTRCGTTGCLMGHGGVLMTQHYGIDLYRYGRANEDEDEYIAEFFGLDEDWFWRWNEAWPKRVREVYEANLPPTDHCGYIHDREGVAKAEWLAVITLLEDLIKEEA